MKTISVEIPDGEYCENCPFVNHYKDDLVNMFGDPTGNVREGYKCNHYGADLQIENKGCNHRLKKCWPCKATEAEKLAMGYAFVFMLLGDGNNDKKINY